MPTNRKHKTLVIYFLDKKQLEMAVSNPSQAKGPCPTVATEWALDQRLPQPPFISQSWEVEPQEPWLIKFLYKLAHLFDENKQGRGCSIIFHS